MHVLQLYQIQLLAHGVMMVSPSGSGKSSAWKVLLKALEKLKVRIMFKVQDLKFATLATVSCWPRLREHSVF
uniref:Dynein heavy chain hydrolytic ATP-binding dynein motor region domain-containing protein n=1 Tax=Amphimedon queenslandica TaxID=400682 RepID=A0A1X7TGG0_AMPQE